MFDIPDAKRIKRSEIFQDGSETSSRPPSPGLEENGPGTLPDYGFEYDFAPRPGPPAKPDNSDLNDDSKPSNPDNASEAPAYTFRLFGHPAVQSASTAIRLSATPEPSTLADALSLDKTHFLRPNRPDSYYFTSALPPEVVARRKTEYATAALSASALSKLAVAPWPGAALPWRVIALPTSSRQSVIIKPDNASQPALELATQSASRRTGRNRPSKRRRVVLHRRAVEKARTEARANMSAAEREAEEREKRTRRNREKKVKRKARDKKKKAAAKGEESAAEAEGGDAAELADGGLDGDVQPQETSKSETSEKQPHPVPQVQRAASLGTSVSSGLKAPTAPIVRRVPTARSTAA